MKLAFVVSAVLGLSSTSALAVQYSGAEVSAALKSITTAEQAVYEKYITSRVKVHGCATSDDFKNKKGTIPPLKTFQDAVLNEAKDKDNGTFKSFFAGKVDPSYSAEAAADILHAYVEASRSTYTKLVIKAALDSKCGKPLEEWAEEDGLPLPAQFTRGLGDGVRKAGKFSFTLLSDWPINKQNLPNSDFEKRAMKEILGKPSIHAEETLAGKKYASSAYPDIAINQTCTKCHNDHKESPRKDFKVGDIMGIMVVRLPIN